MAHGFKGKASALVLCGCACALVALPALARAFELSRGVRVSGIQIRADHGFAESPFARLLWHRKRDFTLAVRNVPSILPGERVGAYDRTW